MKNYYFIGLLSLMNFLLLSCESTCDEGYTEVTEDGSTFCVPEYIAGIEDDNPFGVNLFYHDDFGLIKYENGQWMNSDDQIIEP